MPATREYDVTTSFRVQDAESGELVERGGVVRLDERTSGYLLAAGVVESREKRHAVTMTCPACVDAGRKRPEKLASADELATHYHDRHAGFEPPVFQEDEG